MERNRKPIKKPTIYGQIIFNKAAKNSQWEKDSALSRQCWENWTANTKEETGPLSYTIHKNKFKMEERPNCESRNHKNPRTEHRTLTSAVATSF